MGDLFRRGRGPAAKNLEKLFRTEIFSQPGLKSLPYRYFISPAGPPEGGPLWIFLHGAGGAGRDNRAQLNGGNGFALSKLAQELDERACPGTILAPQCPPDEAWWSPEASASRCGALVSQLAKSWRACQPNRIALIGVSMGGHGVWDLAWRNPGLFAALMPLCGACPPQRAHEIERIPVWGFHGTEDQDVPFERTRDFFSLLESLGWEARLSVLTGVGHRCTQEVFSTFDVTSWLLEQNRDY